MRAHRSLGNSRYRIVLSSLPHALRNRTIRASQCCPASPYDISFSRQHSGSCFSWSVNKAIASERRAITPAKGYRVSKSLLESDGGIARIHRDKFIREKNRFLRAISHLQGGLDFPLRIRCFHPKCKYGIIFHVRKLRRRQFCRRRIKISQGDRIGSLSDFH